MLSSTYTHTHTHRALWLDPPPQPNGADRASRLPRTARTASNRPSLPCAALHSLTDIRRARFSIVKPPAVRPFATHTHTRKFGLPFVRESVDVLTVIARHQHIFGCCIRATIAQHTRELTHTHTQLLPNRAFCFTGSAEFALAVGFVRATISDGSVRVCASLPAFA